MIDQNLIARFQPYRPTNSLFLSFEGIEGSGKTTQIQRLKASLEELGLNVTLMREPGGTPFGEKMREAILTSEEKISPVAEACLMAASRAQLLEQRIIPLLEEKDNIVIVDRYIDSSLAYQGSARGLGAQSVLEIHNRHPLTIVPSLTFYLKIDLETSMKRQDHRGSKKDYFEKENSQFYTKLIEGYDHACSIFTERFQVIDGKKTQDEVSSDILSAAQKLIKG
ncbi:MAG: dTMP kinase [Halobacteriovoraceae bacterium]|nr:dTMP kinase [Halobacteriovoraceae bacterium]|tara:strand:- start:141609 stop:142280 length:672 start_codon:yes stop_codon:yes gene_type:complete